MGHEIERSEHSELRSLGNDTFIFRGERLIELDAEELVVEILKRRDERGDAA